MYYNNEVKQRYLDTLCRKDKINRANKMFSTASERETELKRDLGLWGHDDVVWLLNQLATIDIVTLNKQIVEVYAYQQWHLQTVQAINSDLFDRSVVACNQKKVAKEDIDFTETIKHNLVLDFSEVVTAMKAVIPFDEGIVVPPLLCFAWLNINIEDAVRIPYDGVRWSTRQIFNEQGNLLVDDVPSDIYDILWQYANTSVGKSGRKTVYPYHTGYFLRPFLPRGYETPCEPIKVNTASAAIYRVNQRIKDLSLDCCEVTYANIQKSGQFQMMLDKEPMSLYSTEGRAFVNELCGNNQKDFLKSRIYDVLYIYEQYKKAFNLN